jgi:hypothetical protein
VQIQQRLLKRRAVLRPVFRTQPSDSFLGVAARDGSTGGFAVILVDMRGHMRSAVARIAASSVKPSTGSTSGTISNGRMK